MKQIQFTANWTGKEEILNADNLMENEVAVLIASRNNEYADCYDEPTWSFSVCDNSGLNSKVYRGVVSSLIKKGYARVSGYDEDQVFGLTQAGKALFEEVEG